MKSLELNWIRNVDKSLVIPEVVFSYDNKISGRYYDPSKDEIEIDGSYYDLDFGLIEISVYSSDIESTLAHEWRHHWQVCNGWNTDYIFKWPLNCCYEYDKCIFKYFTENKHELDALKFEYKHSRIYDYWEELLYEYL
jgi:hypothetical protein